MAIFGIEGGIGTGKTLCVVYYGLQDLYAGKTIYSNIKLKGIPAKLRQNIIYLDKERLKNILTLVKEKKFDMKNSTVLIQEAHNYIDSRKAMFKENRMISYWILQSRHTGEGSCDIIYDTQDLGQVDIRLRRNTDYIFRPKIVKWNIDGKIKMPVHIRIYGNTKLGHKYVKFNKLIDVTDAVNSYDTHEVVDF